MKQTKPSKKQTLTSKNHKKQPQPQKYKKTNPQQDQQQQMIINSSLPSTESIQTESPKYYHFMNPNLEEEDYQDENGKINNFRQLTMRNLIILLSLVSLLMLSSYKIISEVYQIKHAELTPHKNTKDTRLSMQKNGADSKDMTLLQGLSQEQRQDFMRNKQQISRQRMKQKYESARKNHGSFGPDIQFQENINKQQTFNNQIVNSQPGAGVNKLNDEHEDKKLDENESVMKEKEEDIKIALSNSPQLQTLNVQSPSHGQRDEGVSRNPQTTLSESSSLNPVLKNWNQYLWSTYTSAPVAKANITKAQAIQWKNYLKMLQLPLNLPITQNPLLQQQFQYFQDKYQINSYPQLPICVVIPSYNNAANDRYKLNMQSILQQNYSNYHVVFIDDKSSDHTGQLVKEYLGLFEQKYQQKVKIIINQERKMAMPNLRYAAMNQCREEELFIIIDGDDALVGRQVFKLFSAVMQAKNLWVMWTNFLTPKGTIGYSREYSLTHRMSDSYRRAGFVMSHLRAYYTKLFRLIKEQDLKDENGEYYHAANDVAICIPILEMAHMHTAYVPEISYFYNMNTGLNNHKVRLKEQKNNDKKIRKKPKYQALESLDFTLKAPTQVGSANGVNSQFKQSENSEQGNSNKVRSSEQQVVFVK